MAGGRGAAARLAPLAVAAVRLVLLGAQATGKSSLLVALYGALVHHRAGDLRIVRTDDEVEFLSRGLAAFGRGESLQRTEIDSPARLALELSHGDDVVSIDIPDRSGELLNLMLDNRIWDSELERQVSQAEGALLFLRADRLPAPRSHDGAAANGAGDHSEHAANNGGGPIARARLNGHDAQGKDEQWSPAVMPADVRTVDLLQAMLEERSAMLPIAVVLSAWDRAGRPDERPGDLLAERLPLLTQFLASHASQLPHATFGVSAQGGDFGDGSADSSADPWDRAFIIGPDGLRTTFAAPIMWLIGAAA